MSLIKRLNNSVENTSGVESTSNANNKIKNKNSNYDDEKSVFNVVSNQQEDKSIDDSTSEYMDALNDYLGTCEEPEEKTKKLPDPERYYYKPENNENKDDTRNSLRRYTPEEIIENNKNNTRKNIVEIISEYMKNDDEYKLTIEPRQAIFEFYNSMCEVTSKEEKDELISEFKEKWMSYDVDTSVLYSVIEQCEKMYANIEETKANNP